MNLEEVKREFDLYRDAPAEIKIDEFCSRIVPLFHPRIETIGVSEDRDYIWIGVNGIPVFCLYVIDYVIEEIFPAPPFRITGFEDFKSQLIQYCINYE